MTTRLPEPTAFKDPQEQEFMNQLLRVLRNSLGDQEADIQNNQSSTATSIEDLQTQLNGYVANSDRGDITTSAGFATWTIDNDAVTFPKFQNIDTDKLLGRVTAGTGDVEQVTCTDFAQSLIDDVDAPAARTTLGLGSAAVAALIDDDTFATATATNVASAESTKAYVDSSATNSRIISVAMVPTTSGSSVSIASGLPSGVKRITVMFDGVSLSGTDNFLIQLGNSGGLETTGYDSTSVVTGAGTVDSTAGFIIRGTAGTVTLRGILNLSLMDAATNTWACNYILKTIAGFVAHGAGTKALSATLDRVSIVASGANTFDAGNIGLTYEF